MDIAGYSVLDTPPRANHFLASRVEDLPIDPDIDHPAQGASGADALFNASVVGEMHVEAAMKRLGGHVREARKRALRESREAFAKRIGCSPITLDRIERGDPGVSMGMVMRALEVMRVLDSTVAAASPNLLIAARQVLVAADDAPPGFRD
jgi:DNA-binding XRE family transcriptional regulator